MAPCPSHHRPDSSHTEPKEIEGNQIKRKVYPQFELNQILTKSYLGSNPTPLRHRVHLPRNFGTSSPTKGPPGRPHINFPPAATLAPPLRHQCTVAPPFVQRGTTAEDVKPPRKIPIHSSMPEDHCIGLTPLPKAGTNCSPPCAVFRCCPSLETIVVRIPASRRLRRSKPRQVPFIGAT
jgi:hypothetical protein